MNFNETYVHMYVCIIVVICVAIQLYVHETDVITIYLYIANNLVDTIPSLSLDSFLIRAATIGGQWFLLIVRAISGVTSCSGSYVL